jgi:hypothetical protein
MLVIAAAAAAAILIVLAAAGGRNEIMHEGTEERTRKLFPYLTRDDIGRSLSFPAFLSINCARVITQRRGK